MFLLPLAVGYSTPSQAGHLYKHHGGKFTLRHIAPPLQAGAIGVSSAAPLSPAALNADLAIRWQDSLHGETN
ncbi:hypothetical protein [Methylobacterium oxalidis]|uniref:Uncharacterized protein n=1 Tax=Methylobacterium oxalidis TaxID=944322 RepID=A0A512IWQ1_9HYPH|nr:hypothetical protein [Methylobacterium oxalidis]GEP02150.1 hypothetical protein MOX02_01880 [Methylobacterium oxalidis]GLS62095.1 hypothetical protein GCM10007888_04760 [Methylobacterium oxalidis]